MSEEPSVVWVVSKGEYSDYTVMCACPTREHAERVAAAYNGGDVEHWSDARVETLPWIEEPRRLTTYTRWVNVWDDGTTSDERVNERNEWEFDLLYAEDRNPVRWRWVRAPMHEGRGGRLEVSGTSRTRVAKVFSEKRAQLLADDAMRHREELVS